MKQGNGRVERTVRNKLAEQGLELRGYILSRYDNGETFNVICVGLFHATGILIDRELVRQWVRKWRLETPAPVEATK